MYRTRAVTECFPEFSFAAFQFGTTKVLNRKGAYERKPEALNRRHIRALRREGKLANNLKLVKTKILFLVFLSFWDQEKH